MSETTTNGQAAIAASTRIGLRHGDDRIGGHDPQRLDAAVGDGAEHVDGLQAGLGGDSRRAPEALHAVAIVGVLDVHVGGEHVGEAADLAAAHGVRLAGERERPHAGPADAAGRQVAVDDGVDLVGAGGGLVDALAVDGDDLLASRRTAEELRAAALAGRPSARIESAIEGRCRGSKASAKPVVCVPM